MTMAVRINDVFNARAVALNRTEVASNRTPFLGEGFFPNRKKVGLDISWIKSHKGLNAILAPSNFDAIPVLRTREGFKMENTQMVFFRETMQVKEEDMMKLAMVEDATAGNAYVREVLDDIYDDTNKLLDAAEIAAEVMRMQLLATTAGTPKISIGVKDNTIYTYNYDPDGSYLANHYLALTGNAKWTAPTTATPLTDINNAKKYLASIGVNPKYALMTSKTFGYLASNDQVKAALVTITGRPFDFVDDNTVREVFERMTGLTILIYDKMYLNYAGVQTNFYPDDQVTIIGDGVLGRTWFGVTPEERTLMTNANADIAMYDDRIACTVVTRPGPPVSTNTTVSQLCVPSYEGMDSTYVIKVN